LTIPSFGGFFVNVFAKTFTAQAEKNGRNGEETVVKAILVGCGAMSRTWLEAAAGIDGLAIVGLVDLDEDRARARAAEFGLDAAVVGRDLAAVLSATDADVVFDVVVPQARHGVATTAFAHGLHVLSEKPLATSLPEAADLLEAARAAGVIHAVVQNRRYLPAIRRIRRCIDAGTIGSLTEIHADFFLAPHFGGFREEMRHVLLLDMAIHTFDAARAMTGLAARRVFCREWNPAGSWYRHGASAFAVFDMGGPTFTYRGSWCAEGPRTSWEGSWRIVGDRGAILWDGSDDLRADVVDPEAERDGLFSSTRPATVPPLDPADRVGGHAGVIADFLAAVAGGPPPETRAEANLGSLAMVLAAIESAETGGAADIPHAGDRA
jgi:predicted dehydrogenase